MKKLVRCLLVDDDFDDREIFLMTLTELGEHIRCRTAGNGVEAINMLEGTNEPPDFIFLDISMPKMNGLECLEKIRKSENLDSCHIYMYSNAANEELLRKTGALNAGFLVKPSTQGELYEMLRDVLAQ